MKALDFKMVSPESQGLKSETILAFLDDIAQQGVELHACLLSIHDKLVFEGYWKPFGPDKVHRICSAGKVLVSAATLFAIQEGLYQLDDRLCDLLPWAVPEAPSPHLKELTVYHLLTMTVGHIEDSFGRMLSATPHRAEAFCSMPIAHTPGTSFLYDNGSPDMLALILYEKTRQKVSEYLASRLFQPLGFGEVRVNGNGELDELPSFCIATRDLMKLATLFKNHGAYDDRQIIREDLVRLATSFQVPSLSSVGNSPVGFSDENTYGYGFYFWRNSIGGFRMDGGAGQYAVVIPDMDLIFACNANDSQSSTILRLLFKHIRNGYYARPIPEAPAVLAALRERMESLTMAPSSDISPRKDHSGVYRLAEPFYGVEQITLKLSDTRQLITLRNGAAITADIGAPGMWAECEIPFAFTEMLSPTECRKLDGGFRLDTTVGYDVSVGYSTGRWLDGDTLELRFRSDGWMGGHIVDIHFRDGGLCLRHRCTLADALVKRTELPVTLPSYETCAEGVKTQ